MKTVGVTAEYNPFHNGHAYHIRRARELSGADCVIAVMSGDFTQRGEAAVSDKWERAKAAVSADPHGADLVIELPFVFACSRAEIFARGAVDMLIGLGADCISFGCEAEDPSRLRGLAEILVSEEAAIAALRDSHMKSGASGAKAYELAVKEAAGEEAAELLHSPNNILAVEYLKRMLYWRRQGRHVDDIPVRRYGSGYGEVSGQREGFAGAGALRKMIEAGEDVSPYVPGTPAFQDMKLLHERYMEQLRGVVLRSAPEELSRICGVGEGMENSIIREARKAQSLEALIDALVSKRYTRATVSRALTHILVGSGWGKVDELTSAAPSAGRLLAAGKAGRKYIRTCGESFRIVTNRNKEADMMEPMDLERFVLDEQAADVYNLLCGKDIYASSDRVRSPFIAKD